MTRGGLSRGVRRRGLRRDGVGRAGRRDLGRRVGRVGRDRRGNGRAGRVTGALSPGDLQQAGAQGSILFVQGLEGIGVGGKHAMAEFVRQHMEGIVDFGLVDVFEDLLQGVSARLGLGCRLVCGRSGDRQRDDQQHKEEVDEPNHGVKLGRGVDCRGGQLSTG